MFFNFLYLIYANSLSANILLHVFLLFLIKKRETGSKKNDQRVSRNKFKNNSVKTEKTQITNLYLLKQVKKKKKTEKK